MYVKLFPSLLDSSLWMQPDHVLRVFLTFLLVCDQEGNVSMSIPGIARRAHVPLAKAREALSTLEMPDPDSQSKAEEGRRIVRIGEAGEPVWRIVNYQRYREMGKRENELARHRERVKRYRAKRDGKSVTCDAPVTPGDVSVTQGDVSCLQAEGEAEDIITTPPPPSLAEQERREAEADWAERQKLIQVMVSPQVFSTWFAPLRPKQVNGVLRMQAPNPQARSFIENNFGDLLADLGIVLCDD
jgi:hypothetical protein